MLIRVKVFPHSKKNQIREIQAGKYEVYVRASAERNQANEALLSLIRTYFADCQGVRLVSGATRPNKILEILGM